MGWRCTSRRSASSPSPPSRRPVELHRPEPRESLPTRLDAAAVALRHPAVRERFRLTARAVAAFRSTLDERGFVEIQTPKIVASATEGGANVFSVDYFGREAFLAQSPQFFKQTMVGVFERVYEVGPVFRAEPHETGRHLAEYVSLDAELGFIRDHRDVIDLVREVVFAMIEAVGGTPPADAPIVRFEDVRSGEEPDLSPEDERRICAEHGELVFVEGFPTWKRPFYTHPDPERPEWSRGFDLLYRGLEIVTGGQRLHRYEDYTRGARRARSRRGAVRLVPRRVPLRDAAARRLRARPRAVRRAGRRRPQRAGDDALPARPLATSTLTAPMLGPK